MGTLYSYQVPSIATNLPRSIEPQQPYESEQPYAASSVVDQSVTGTVSVTPKRKPGRPPKLKPESESEPVSVPDPGFDEVVENGSGPSLGKRRRGRPAKERNPAVEVVVPFGSPVDDVAVGSSGQASRGRGRGRPAKVKAYSGKPRGRPKKNSPFVKHTDRQGLETANEDLLNKLEDMQLKVRGAVEILKPILASRSEPDALTALQQLEELSTMNITSVIDSPLTTVPIDLVGPPESTFSPEPLVPPSDASMDFDEPPEMNIPSPSISI